MTSFHSISRLKLWVKKVLDESNNKFSIVLMLGNNSFADIVNREHLEKVHREITLSHRDDCNECINGICNRLIFAECNL